MNVFSLQITCDDAKAAACVVARSRHLRASHQDKI
jgi:hypothetical protein